MRVLAVAATVAWGLFFVSLMSTQTANCEHYIWRGYDLGSIKCR